MRILLVEDDDLQGEWVREELERFFNEAPTWIVTESEFRDRVGDIVKNPPDVAVVDLMLQWSEPSPNMPERPEDAEDNRRAGLRCRQLLAEHEATKTVPVILYTVLDRIELEDDLRKLAEPVTYLRKDSDITPLIELIRETVNEASQNR